jgi:hypothetical protein
MAAAACSPAKAPPAATSPSAPMAISSVAPAAIPDEMPIVPIPFKRVDEWRFVDLAEGPAPIEDQLRQHLEAALPSARFSPAYTCTAREHANFREKYAALPEEYLEAQMLGRCGAPTGGRSVAITYRSDGTLLERPFSPELLNDITAKLTGEGRDVTAFGVTARYVGQNVLVLMDAATPEATIDVGVPGADGRVLVTGEVLGNFVRARALINQGEAGTEECEPLRAQWPKYAFQCTFRPADEQAWISVTAVDRSKGWENPLVELPVRRSGLPAPAAWKRPKLALAKHADPRKSLVMAINASRAKLGRAPLKFAAEQSTFIQPIYQQAYRQNARGDWLGDNAHRARMLKGDRVEGLVRAGRVASGIAFDGDAADWLAYRLLLPISRETLMDPRWDQIAIATHREPNVGFGAAAVLYSLVTPERARELEERIVKVLQKLRGDRPTERLRNPREIEDAARQVASGSDPSETFTAALARLNRASSGKKRVIGALLTDTFPEALLEVKALKFGVAVTHHRAPSEDWARELVFIWYRE